jgi:hypothetical protein
MKQNIKYDESIDHSPDFFAAVESFVPLVRYFPPVRPLLGV